MKRFQDRVYTLQNQTDLFVYDSGWECFRPVVDVVWNPRTRSIELFYGKLCADPLDENYGYGSSEMKDRCITLTDRLIGQMDTAEELSDVHAFWKWTRRPLTWVFDRPLLLHPCADPTFEVRKTFPVKMRTLRKAPRTFDFRATKRTIT